MKKAKRIYCIEGVHDWGNRYVEPSVEPLLQLLMSTGYWDDYVYRKCATQHECQFFLTREWAPRCDGGSILYFSSHGGPGEIWLSGSPDERHCEVVTLDMLAAWEIDCSSCLVHFSGCDVFADGVEESVRKMLKHTKASYTSGYGVEVNWLDILGPPAVALEIMFFSSIAQLEINIRTGHQVKTMRKLAKDLNKVFYLPERFGSCEFKLYDRWRSK
ncbi:MAG: hypothetical protein OXG15_10750 [Gammaproteobacteria bacterium]|nr:hypothetical protein [Gammaproteobacteria bacterium]